MSTDKAYASDKTAAAILDALAGALPEGLTNGDIAQAAACTPSQVTRLTAALADAGWVEKLPTGRFRITTRFGRMTFRVMAGFDRAARQLDDLKRNYTLSND